MPNLRTNEPAFAKMSRLLKGYASTTEIADAIDVSAPTALKRINYPEYMTLGDIKKISQRIHIPIDELREAIRW